MCVKLCLMADKAAGCSALYVQPATGRKKGIRRDGRKGGRLPTCHGMQMLASAFDVAAFHFHFLPSWTLPTSTEGSGGFHLEADAAAKEKSTAAWSWMGKKSDYNPEKI